MARTHEGSVPIPRPLERVMSLCEHIPDVKGEQTECRSFANFVEKLLVGVRHEA
jgi:hypothetical protein